MLFFLISVLAGILTILAPCILPLLPVIIGSSSTENSKNISRKSLRIIFSLALSVIVFTLLLKASTLLIEIPNSFWTWFSGSVIVVLGFVMLFPSIFARNRLVMKLKLFGDRKLAKGHTKNNSIGDYVVGVALGPVFSTCSPTYLFIIATVLPATFIVGLVYLFGFVIGLVFALILVAYFGQGIVNKLTTNTEKVEITKKIFGALILIVGVAIITGLDKKLEAWILDSGYGATINFEQNLIDTFNKDKNTTSQTEVKFKNKVLQSAFPNTNWSKADPSIEKALSGGPGKDGIPAIDNPYASVSTGTINPRSVETAMPIL
jgi:cytochrome c biogenesis protein CcdA